jgi:branched-chain amino acid transport system ATP-binding protein
VLLVENLVSRYGRIEVLHGVSLSVAEGEIVTLVGSNGAGKTTLLRTISGVQPSMSGSIRFAGERIDGLPAHRRVAKGIAQVPEGRQIFAPLTVEDNLRLGAVTRRDADIDADLAEVYVMFSALEEKRHLPAGALSGGQQQMLAIGRALMARPRLMLLDEPSMGLAPRLVEQISLSSPVSNSAA